jgi:hypothetical protein
MKCDPFPKTVALFFFLFSPIFLLSNWGQKCQVFHFSLALAFPPFTIFKYLLALPLHVCIHYTGLHRAIFDGQASLSYGGVYNSLPSGGFRLHGQVYKYHTGSSRNIIITTLYYI